MPKKFLSALRVPVKVFSKQTSYVIFIIILPDPVSVFLITNKRFGVFPIYHFSKFKSAYFETSHQFLNNVSDFQSDE